MTGIEVVLYPLFFNLNQTNMKNNIGITLSVTLFLGVLLGFSIIGLINSINTTIKNTRNNLIQINTLKSDSAFLMRCIESKDSTIEAQEKQIKNLKANKICKASYYAEPFHGRKTASGEKYNMYEFTAAHKTLAFGTKVRVTNIKNNKSVVVKITDRGPYIKGREIDLSLVAFQAIGNVKSGVLTCKIDKI